MNHKRGPWLNKTEFNYYQEEFSRLIDSKYHKSIILSDNQGNKTKTLDLNAESIPELIKFLKIELKKLKKLTDK